MFRVKKLKLTGKLVLAISSVSFLGVIAIIAFMSFNMQKNMFKLTSDSSEQMAVLYGNETKALFENVTSSLIAYNSSVVSAIEQGKMDRSDLIDLTKTVLKSEYGVIGLWTIFEPNAFDGKDAQFVGTELGSETSGRFGFYITTTNGYLDVNTTVANRIEVEGEENHGYYSVPKQTGKIYYTHPYTDTVNGKEVLMTSIAVPLYYNGNFIGNVGADISIDSLFETFGKMKYFDTGYSYLLNEELEVIYSPNEEQLATPFSSIVSQQSLDKIKTTLTSNKTSFYEEVDKNTGKKIMGTAVSVNFKDFDKSWVFVVVAPVAEINKVATNSAFFSIIIGIAILVAIMLFTVFIIRRNIRPIKALVDISRKIVDGDMNVEVSSNSYDEIGELTRAFASVVNTIRTLVGDINEMVSKFEGKGDIYARVDETKFNGTYNELAKTINSAFSTTVDEIVDMAACLNEYAYGDFSASFKKCIGEKVILNDAFDKLQDNLRSVVADVSSLSSAISVGNLGVRIDEAKYSNDWAKLASGLNKVLIDIVNPINETVSALDGLGKGDLSVGVSGNYKGEFEKMKNSVNTTVDSLSGYIKEISYVLNEMSNKNFDLSISHQFFGSFNLIKESLNKIISSFNVMLGEVSVSAHQTSSGASLISNSSSTLAQGASAQMAAVESLIETTKVITDQSAKNASDTNTVNELSERTKNDALACSDQMKKMLKAMQELNEASSNISKIINVINDISFQTNLLALNAAVEAARAGQYGKGFAVVAEEVRSLASRSQVAVKETTELINTTISKVAVGIDTSNKTSESLNGIVKNITGMSSLLSSVAESTALQEKEVEKINDSIGQIARVVQDNTSLSEEVASASQELNAQSDVFRTVVSEFKLSKS